jgi:hypothetical protein
MKLTEEHWILQLEALNRELQELAEGTGCEVRSDSSESQRMQKALEGRSILKSGQSMERVGGGLY